MKRIAIPLLITAACGGAPKKSPGPGDTGDRKVITIGEQPILGQPEGGGMPPPPTGGEKGGVFLQDGEIETVGAIDKAVVRKVVREHFEALRYCYEATLLANPNIAGTVIAKFTIQVDGTVHDVTAAGVHPDVESCVATKVKTFKFPKPDGTRVEVAYPFTFKPS